jgi:AAA+ ATPase superfamily predicted ATPase
LFEKIGRWWDKNEEIDLIAINDEEKKILFGEAKWSKKPVGVDIYDNLKRKSMLVDWNKDERAESFCLFSRSGFTDNLLKRAKKEKIVLFHKDRHLEP